MNEIGNKTINHFVVFCLIYYLQISSLGLKRVYDLLKHEDEQVLGNASLCLSHCATLPKVSAALAKTNVIMDLLVLTRDGNNTSVRHNCAILIAKLTQGHPR